jgi:hypothetical protein
MLSLAVNEPNLLVMPRTAKSGDKGSPIVDLSASSNRSLPAKYASS